MINSQDVRRKYRASQCGSSVLERLSYKDRSRGYFQTGLSSRKSKWRATACSCRCQARRAASFFFWTELHNFLEDCYMFVEVDLYKL